MTLIKQDLLKPVHVRDAKDDPSAQSRADYEIVIELTKGGETVAPSGTLVVYIVLPYGETLRLTEMYEGNQIVATIPASAFRAAGRILAVVKLENEDEVTTVGAVAITVKGVS